MMTWEDLQSWCDDLSSWIVELDELDELKKAFPKGQFPLVANRDKDVLAYLVVWMCCKRKMRAPPNIDSRMMLSESFKGPWQEIYSRLVQRLENNLTFRDIYDLAG